MMNAVRFFCLSATVAALAGCGADNSQAGDNVGSTEQAFSSASCAGVSASVTFSSYLPKDYYSPQSYNKCTKSFVYDVTNLQSSWTGGWEQPLSVMYGDETITNQADCEDLEEGIILYKKVGSSWVDQTGEVRTYGLWFGSYCQLSIDTPVLHWGDSYRVAATVRRMSGTNPTQIIHFYWPKNA